MKQREHLFVFIVIICSLILKYVVYYNYPLPQFVDVKTYISQGANFINNGKLDHHIMPLYPIFLYFSEKLIGIIHFNILISTFNVIGLYLIAKIIFSQNKNYSYLVLLAISFYPYNIFFSISGFAENFYIFFLIYFFLFMYLEKPFIGILFAITGLYVKSNHEFLIPVIIIIFFIFIYKKNLKKTFIFLGITFVTYVILMLPWWYFNYQKYDSFVRTNLGWSYPLYIGNNIYNKSGGGIYIDKYDVEKYPERFSKIQKDFSLEPFRNQKGFEIVNNEVQVKSESTIEDIKIRDKLFKQKALDFIFNQKIQFIKLTFIKLKRFWGIFPSSQEFQDIKYKLLGIGVTLPLFIFSFLGVLITVKKKFFYFYPILTLIFYYNIIHILTIVSFRYRYPVENFLILLAVYAVLYLNKLVRKK